MSSIFCPAKVNLFLAIRGRDTSGYHEIETVLVRVPQLADELRVEPAATFEFHCDTLPVEGNSVVKAVQLLEEKTGRRFLYKITLIKHIPPQSGLGGGASDAAAILLHLNEIENLQLSANELATLGAQIGMDVPFFLSGAPVALGTHYGEKIFALQPLPSTLSLMPELTGLAISTRDAYARWDARGLSSTASSKWFLAALQYQNPELIIQNMHNDFELVTPEAGPYSKNRHLCGSGGAVFTTQA